MIELKTFPLSFLRDLETKYKIDIESEFNAFSISNPYIQRINIDQQIQDTITNSCIEVNVAVTDVIGKTRKREITLLRQVLMSYFYLKFPISLKSIGNHFGGRDHSTVINARQTVNDLIESKDLLLTYYFTRLGHIIDVELIKSNLYEA